MFVLVIGLFALAGCDTDDTAIRDNLIEEALVAPRTVDRPFKGEGFGVDAAATGTLSCALPAFERAVQGEGTATHIGRYTTLITECFNPETFMSTGYARIYAPNGDMLHQDFVIQYYQLPEDPPYVVHGMFTTWTFNGGASTGRFEGVTGTGTGTVLGDLAAGRYEWDLEGTINY